MRPWFQKLSGASRYCTKVQKTSSSPIPKGIPLRSSRNLQNLRERTSRSARRGGRHEDKYPRGLRMRRWPGRHPERVHGYLAGAGEMLRDRCSRVTPLRSLPIHGLTEWSGSQGWVSSNHLLASLGHDWWIHGHAYNFQVRVPEE